MRRRSLSDGDIFKKFGGGTKKLKDYLIDKKIPVSEIEDIIFPHPSLAEVVLEGLKND